MITAFAHVCFTVSDLSKALAFYCDGLGLKIAFEFRDDSGYRYGAYVKVYGRSFIELFENHELAPAGTVSFQHICLEVPSITQAVETIRRRGITITDPKLEQDHSYQAWITDPDGNSIELHEYTPQSWQTPHLA